MTAVENVAKFLSQVEDIRDDIAVGGHKLVTLGDLRELVRLATPGPDSYVLRDRDGDWWVYAHDLGGWISDSKLEHFAAHGHDGGAYGLSFQGDPEESAARIVEHFGCWA
jgi:hypothetical protein